MNQNEENKKYQQKVDQYSPKSPVFKNIISAFLIGGLICTIGQGILMLIKMADVGAEQATAWTSIIMVFLGALLTGIGWPVQEHWCRLQDLQTPSYPPLWNIKRKGTSLVWLPRCLS